LDCLLKILSLGFCALVKSVDKYERALCVLEESEQDLFPLVGSWLARSGGSRLVL
jgi:hypothetical protein